jgi:MoaA/NifB/PqqE/SkfB family radical SAM enzyme
MFLRSSIQIFRRNTIFTGEPCGGCRARAYFYYGDYLMEDPRCVFTQKKNNGYLKKYDKGET